MKYFLAILLFAACFEHSYGQVTFQVNNSQFQFPESVCETSFPIELIRIYNSLGPLMITTNNETEININRFPTGIYFISIQTKEGEFFRKFI